MQDLIHKGIDVSGSESMFQGCHFIHTTPQCPDVRFVVIWLIREELWTHVVRSTNDSVSQFTRSIQHSGYAKITNLDDVVLTEEDILSLCMWRILMQG